MARAIRATAASEGVSIRDFVLGVLGRDIKRGGWTAGRAVGEAVNNGETDGIQKVNGDGGPLKLVAAMFAARAFAKEAEARLLVLGLGIEPDTLGRDAEHALETLEARLRELRGQ